MTRTLRFGYDSASPRLQSRINHVVGRRHTHAGYDRCMELAAQDFARHVAAEVSPKLRGKPQVTFSASAPRFGKRLPSR